MEFEKGTAKRVAKTAAGVSSRTLGSIVALALKLVGTIFLLGLTTLAVFGILFSLYIRTTLEPSIHFSLDDFTIDLNSHILEWNPETGLHEEAVMLESGEERTWVYYEDINRYLIYAAVAFEDRRFFEHRGVDWYRTAAAFHTMFLGDGRIFGASTITQQLVKNLTQEDDVTVRRKLTEIFRALEVERIYTKEEILEWYLNIFALGGRISGVQAAARFYYGVDQSELTLAQAASIVGITQFPSRYNPYLNPEYNERKRNEVLAAMYAQGYISYEAYRAAIVEPIVLSRLDGAHPIAPIYTFYEEAIIRDLIRALQEERDLSEMAARNLVFRGGLRIYSAMDPRVQGVIDEAFASTESIRRLPAGAQASIVIMDHRNGHILGFAGRIGEKTTNMVFCLGTMARRPPGSAIKPISAFGPAMEHGVVRPGDMFEDSPILLNGRQWPRNAGGTWTHARMNAVRAMEQSTNTVAVHILNAVGTDRAYDFMVNRLHVGLDPNDNAMAPLALGQLTHGITLRESTAAFAAFANDGIFTHSVTFTRVTDANGEVLFDNTIGQQEPVFKAEVAGQMTAMLLRAVNSGTGRAAIMSGYDVAGKTGTSEHSRDRYFVGYTPHLTAGVWTGFVQNEGALRGTNPAALIFRDVMTAAHIAADRPPARFQNLPSLAAESEAIETIDICEDSGLLATDACRNDLRGNRTTPFIGEEEHAPTAVCHLHEVISVCAATNLLPNETCTTHYQGVLSSERGGVGSCPMQHDYEYGEPDPEPTPTPDPTPPPEPTPTPDPTPPPEPTPTPDPTPPPEEAAPQTAPPEPQPAIPNYDPIPVSTRRRLFLPKAG